MATTPRLIGPDYCRSALPCKLDRTTRASSLTEEGRVSRSEHRVVIRRSGRHSLENVPVFDDSSGIIETKNIDAGVVLVSWPLLKAMQDDEASLSDGPFELYPFAWVLRSHPLEVFDECSLPVGDFRIVLDVLVAGVPFRSPPPGDSG